MEPLHANVLNSYSFQWQKEAQVEVKCLWVSDSKGRPGAERAGRNAHPCE